MSSAPDVEQNGEPSRKRSKLENGSSSPQRIAYLGPAGTYGQQAALAFTDYLVQEPYELVPCETIPDIWTTEAEFLVMPLRNTIHGPVIETVKSLLSVLDDSGRIKGKRPEVIGELDLSIEHCLVARKGIRMDEVKWVRSHEQALGQCEVFLRKHLPSVEKQKWSSTAAAALSLLEPTPGDLLKGEGAAICSKAVLSVVTGQLDILGQSIQTVKNNHTQFIFLARDYDHEQRKIDPSDIQLPLQYYALPDLSALQALLRSTKGVLNGTLTQPDPKMAGVDPYPVRVLALIEDKPPPSEGIGIPGIVHLGSATYNIHP